MKQDGLGPDSYRALFEHSLDAVLFAIPGGRILAANPAACRMFKMTEAQFCELGRQGLADPDDPRWEALLAERDRTGEIRGVCRMLRGDGVPMEVEISSTVFSERGGQRRTCTILHNVTDRVRMEKALVEATARQGQISLTDDLTGLRNRRGFRAVGTHLIDVADRQLAEVHLLWLEVEDLRTVASGVGREARHGALRAVAAAMRGVLRSADVVARLGGDDFVALLLGIDAAGRHLVEQRLADRLSGAPLVGGVKVPVEVSMGWAVRHPQSGMTLEELMLQGEWAVATAKSA